MIARSPFAPLSASPAPRAALLWTALCALLAAGCGGTPASKAAADPTAADPTAADPTAADPTEAPVDPPVEPAAGGGPERTPAPEGGPTPPRPATRIEFQVTAFEATEGGGASARSELIPTNLGARAQFWPGHAGDVIERQVGSITHLLAGDAVQSAWVLGDPAALAKADQLALKVVSVSKLPPSEAAIDGAGRFGRTAVDAGGVPGDGKWYRIRFFPGGVWKDGQVQGYLRLTDKVEWYRVDGLPRGLFGPQTRDYQPGDLFEFRAVERPTGVKLYPFE